MYIPVAFVDDDLAKVGSGFMGVPVAGTTSELPSVCLRYAPELAVIAIPSAPGAVIRRMVHQVLSSRLPVRIAPSLLEIIHGRLLHGLRNVEVQDLLRREVHVTDVAATSKQFQDKTVLVTGAGGSIGSELCRQLGKALLKRLVLLDHNENGMFYLRRFLNESYPNLHVEAVVGDIKDAAKMRWVMENNRPDVLFHAAAHKHVPLMEENPEEAIKNNVGGTLTVATAARDAGVGTFVLISTDKAVEPSSVMGATKRVAELTMQALNEPTGTRFTSVRFGNVLGSDGSVIPVFREQIAMGGPVTITDPRMTRFFMTIPEAAQLVLRAAAAAENGKIFILDMGKPVRILDLAHDFIRLSGLEPGVDIPIQITGARPGEKLHEELWTEDERMSAVKVEQLYMVQPKALDRTLVMQSIEMLLEAARRCHRGEVRRLLFDVTSQFGGEKPAALREVRA
jgi:FlaA1/EpsC-like NDP-sugar epimerase